MKRMLQAMMMLTLVMPAARGQEGGRAFAWTPVKVPVSMFSRDLGMLDAEREEYATSLANCAANSIAQAKASPAALDRGQRLLAVALNLSPRNRRAIIVNFQLTKGTLPEETKGDYSAPVLARLLLTRGQLLAKTDSQENHLVARLFFQLAAELDPKNEDAVYASEVDRLDHGAVDWPALTRPRGEATPEPAKESVRPPGPPRRP